jgi:hypothetical protein
MGQADRYRLARYAVQVLGPNQTDPPQTWDDHELADAFLYGDLVHADERHQQDAAAANLRERYRAAFGLLADLVALLWRTLGLVWAWRRDLDLPDWAWTAEVSIEGARWLEREGAFYAAPTGTGLPNSVGWPDGWERVGPEWINSQFQSQPPSPSGP